MTDAASTHQPTRRDFLYIATGAVGAVGAAATLIPLIDQMNPDRATIAAGAPISVDISKVAPGQQIQVFWRSKPILIVNRPPAVLKVLQEKKMVDRLSDPDSTVHQQPPYAQNWHRSVKPEYAVLVGICTHLGCIPQILARPESDHAGGRLAGRLFLPLPRLEIRSRRPRLFRRAGALQPAGAALSLRERQDAAHRRKSAGR